METKFQQLQLLKDEHKKARIMSAFPRTSHEELSPAKDYNSTQNASKSY